MKRPRQWGVTLVELLVSMAIGLVVALASTMAYLAVRNTANATDAMSRMNEDGKLALDMLSREIQMAGFYPAAITRR
jgi:type IV pilus assembly protein PilW